MTAAATPAITLETSGRRIYARGNTYPLREQLRDMGGHWDGEAKAWWVGSGKRAQLEKLVAKHAFRAEAPRASSGSSSPTMVAIEGNTYPVREQIRALGGRWDGASKVWMVPAGKATEARKLVAGAGARKERRSGSEYTQSRCRECRGPIVNCSYHKAMYGLCGQCAFDEYDC